MKISEIMNCLEQVAPLQLQESYDNAGLITGESGWEVTGVLVTLDATEAVINEAISKKCNLVVAHHPIVFSGLKKINGKTYVERTIIKAIKNDIAIYAIHTNLDNVQQGVNQKIAEKLGLINTKILQPKGGLLNKLVTFVPHASLEQVKEAIFAAGAGNIGNYDGCSFTVTGNGTFRGNENSNPAAGKPGQQHTEPESRLETIFPSYLKNKVLNALFQAHPYEEVAYDIYPLENQWNNIGAGLIGDLQEPMEAMNFLKHLKIKMNTASIRYTEVDKPIRKVALCGGAGSFLLRQAISAGADAYVSADFKYHEFFDAENKVMIADIGHYESEFFTKELLKEIILEKFPTFAVLLSEINTNPIKYI